MTFDHESRTEIHKQRFSRAELAKMDAELERLNRLDKPAATRWTRSRLLRIALDRYFNAVKTGRA